MMKLFTEKEKKVIKYKDLEIGACFFDTDDVFCIKVDDNTCLVANDDHSSWGVYDNCDPFDSVYPVNTEIRIVE